ncbi:L-histidine N(alpha)-methyltransferase [Streptomyces sp. SID3343]|uniref:L-histidine N(alpha)-methyltransferase n=1 Tax=Streptomyces sp. SID3343 TaxID=2690260 RepID=UPI00136F8E32|nr:L-histidine N(alpha)-methyltransferase [Streptomyces sp. SID3343]MYW04639.1 hypothetical protein [Streptomyces sp. SID3343]
MEISGEYDQLARATLLCHLRERRFPVRLLYSGAAAHRHMQFAAENFAEYLDGRSEHEVSVLAEALPGSEFPPQLCDVGTSNGVHSMQFLTELDRRRPHCRRYLGIDFSSRLLGVARARLEPFAPADSHFAQGDIESGPIEAVRAWRQRDHGMLLCLLGGTLGNVEDPARTLRNLRDSCRPSDVLALGVFLPPAAGHNVVEPYATAPMRDLMMIPLRAAGFEDHHLELRVEFIDRAVTGTARLCTSLVLADDLIPGGIPFTEGQEIDCFRSQRFDGAEIQRLLKATGWHVTTERDDEEEYLVVVARAV